MPTGESKDVIAFGPFQLIQSARLLLKDGVPIELRGRMLDILIVLLSRPNEIVTKKELLALAWPDVTVEEGSLRFHIAGLRKALGDGKGKTRYIETLTGRGYCFVAPVSWPDSAGGSAKPLPTPADNFPRANLPSRLLRMVGRAGDVDELSRRLAAARFVTIVGAGGVGKTTLAVAVGHELLAMFGGAIVFVDLGALHDPNLVATAVASTLGLSIQSEDATPTVIAYLRSERILLILDTCEHLVEAVAALASRIFTAAPQTHVLATSREALRVEGENIYRLDSLACAPDDPGLTAAIAQTFPATQLFLERAAASGAPLNLGDADAAIIAGMCRKLDGVPLAIELAAGRVGAYGLQQTAALLDQRLTLLWSGPRMAPPRQKTLQATLHWSHELLSEVERAVLRRLAVFVGHFTIEAALAVVPSVTVNHTLVFGVIDSLVAKSMVAVRPVGAMMRYRLLDTTRAYALETEVDDTDLADLAARHANYYRRWLEQSGIEWPRLSTGSEREPHLADLNNVRAALEWCFGADGDTKLGVGLAAAAAPVFLAMSLVTECLRWSERAIHALDGGRGSEEEMNLQSAVGISLMHIHGESDASRLALSRSLTIATERGDVLNQVRLLAPLHMFYLRGGDFKATLDYARRSCVVAGTSENPAAIALAHSILGMSLHLMGDLGSARTELETALRPGQGFQGGNTTYLGFDYHNRTAIALARTLWLQGYPTQAVERAKQAIKDAERVGHPIGLTIVLHWATSIFLWIGDLSTTEQLIDRFISRSETHSLGPSLTIGHAFRGELAIIRGDAKNGVEILRSYLEKLHAAHYELLTSPFNISLVQGLAALNRFTEAMRLIDETIRMIEINGDRSYLPEALRVKGGLFLRMPQSSAADAETCFARSLELSRQQGARGWELRTVIDLAALWAAQGRRAEARTTLQTAFAQFTEGFDTADLKAAQQWITTLS